MSFKSFIKQKIQDALETFFDNTGTDFESVNVQDALVEIGASASPGASWGSSGNNATGTWLVNEGVPSNKAGRTIFLNNAKISKVFTATEDLNTYTIAIYEHSGNEIALTLIDSFVVTAARTASFSTDLTITTGKQLAVKISSGSAKNIVVGTIIKGGL